MCCAKFEQDDTEEGQVVCRMGTGEYEDSPENQIILSDHPGSAKGITVGVEDHSSRFRTWHLPAWVNFSYSTIPQRLRPHKQHKPNLSGPHACSFSRLHSVDEKGKIALTLAQGEPFESPLVEQPQRQPPACISTSLIQQHPPLALWSRLFHIPHISASTT
jgi:hypothetical protein